MTFEEIKTLADWIQYAEEKTGSRKEAIYHYTDIAGNYCYTVLRLSGKKFRCGMIDGDKFTGKLAKPRKDFNAIYTPNEIRLKRAAETKKIICITEGEKDADTLNKYGFAVFTCGAAGSWTNAANDLLKNCPVVILADNDDPGINSANNIAASLKDAAKSIKVIIPCPETESADITDYFNDHSIDDFLNLVSSAEEYTPAAVTDPEEDAVLKSLVCIEEVEEKDAEWLIPFYIPKNQISIVGGSGGEGKTTLVCEIVAAVTTGRQSILTRDLIPEDFTGDPGRVLICNGEDDIATVLRKRLRIAGADLSRVTALPIESDIYAKAKIGSETLEKIVKKIRPDLAIFDPVQSFLPEFIKLSERNAVRQHLSPLIRFGKKYGTTSILVCHCNKMKNVFGLDRIADSKDFADAARSAILLGYSEQSRQHYITHEKSNYGLKQDAILFDITEDGIIYRGRSKQTDREFRTLPATTKAAPARKEAKELIIQTLKDHDGKMNSNDLDRIMMSACGMSEGTLKRAKAELKAAKVIRYSKLEFSSIWETELITQTN